MRVQFEETVTNGTTLEKDNILYHYDNGEISLIDKEGDLSNLKQGDVFKKVGYIINSPVDIKNSINYGNATIKQVKTK